MLLIDIEKVYSLLLRSGVEMLRPLILPLVLLMLIAIVFFRDKIVYYIKKFRRLIYDFYSRIVFSRILSRHEQDRQNKRLAINAYHDAINALNPEEKSIAIRALQNIHDLESYKKLIKLLTVEKDEICQKMIVEALCIVKNIVK